MATAGRFVRIIWLAALVGCSDEPTEKNLTVSPRLVALHPQHAERNIECFLGEGRLLGDLEVNDYYRPAASDILRIDADLREYLTTVANDRRSKLYPHWKSGILAIQSRQDDYFAQFVGVRTAVGKRVIIAFYSHASMCDLREETWPTLTNVPWCADGGERNFTFRYDPTGPGFHQFHVNGRQDGPFGHSESRLDRYSNNVGPARRRLGSN